MREICAKSARRFMYKILSGKRKGYFGNRPLRCHVSSNIRVRQALTV